MRRKRMVFGVEKSLARDLIRRIFIIKIEHLLV